MINRDDRDLIVVNPIDDGVGKSASQRDVQILENLFVKLGMEKNALESFFGPKEKLVSQSRTTSIIPELGRRQLTSASGLTIIGGLTRRFPSIAS